MRGKKVMDIGSGFGVDSITFAQHGASLTFVDLVETNLKVLERLCKIMGLKDVRFVLFEDLDSLKPLDTDYDVIMAMGSLHHAPSDIMKPEYQELMRHLKVGGRWLQLAYPRSRWIRDGRPPFSKLGCHYRWPGHAVVRVVSISKNYWACLRPRNLTLVLLPGISQSRLLQLV